MSGRYSEVVSHVSCPACLRSGRGDNPLYYYVNDEGPLSFAQRRCRHRECGSSETIAAASGIEARQELLKSRRRTHTLMLFIIGEAAAIAATIVAASTVYAMR